MHCSAPMATIFTWSPPHPGVGRGGKLAYQLRVKSKFAGFKYRLEVGAGPWAKCYTGERLVTWPGSTGDAASTDVFVVEITDSSGVRDS